MSTPGFVPRQDKDLTDRVIKIERRIRDIQQNVAGATTASGGVPLSNAAPQPIGTLNQGVATSSSRADHVHSSTLAAQQDVTLSSPAAGHALVYTGTAWANAPRAVSSLPPTGSFAGQLLVCTADNILYRWDGAAWKAAVALGGNAVGTRHSATYTHTTSQSIPNAGSFATALQFPTVSRPSNDVVASGTGNTTFTLQRTGIWTLSGGYRFNPNAGGNERDITVGPITAPVLQGNVFPGTSAANMTISVTDYFTAGTAVSIGAYHNCGVALSTDVTTIPSIGRFTLTYHGQEE